jgi:hypothetical protein
MKKDFTTEERIIYREQRKYRRSMDYISCFLYNESKSMYTMHTMYSLQPHRITETDETDGAEKQVRTAFLP